MDRKKEVGAAYRKLELLEKLGLMRGVKNPKSMEMVSYDITKLINKGWEGGGKVGVNQTF